MKTRVIHTKIWKDGYFSNLTRIEKLVFLFLITNENINMCGCYELNDAEIKLWCGLTEQEIIAIKQKFSRDRKFVFSSGWVRVINHGRYNSYGKGEKQEQAYKRELSLIPPFLYPTDTSIDTSMDTTPILDINPNTEIIKHKEGECGGGRNQKEVTEEDIKEIAKKYSISMRSVEKVKEEFFDYLEINPKNKSKYADYKVAIRSWVRRKIEEGKISVTTDTNEHIMTDSERAIIKNLEGGSYV